MRTCPQACAGYSRTLAMRRAICRTKTPRRIGFLTRFQPLRNALLCPRIWIFPLPSPAWPPLETGTVQDGEFGGSGDEGDVCNTVAFNLRSLGELHTGGTGTEAGTGIRLIKSLKMSDRASLGHAPSGAFTSWRGGAFASRASRVAIASRGGWWMGSVVRSRVSAAIDALGKQSARKAKWSGSLFFFIGFSWFKR